jgi:hypothetical protein
MDPRPGRTTERLTPNTLPGVTFLSQDTAVVQALHLTAGTSRRLLIFCKALLAKYDTAAEQA